MCVSVYVCVPVCVFVCEFAHMSSNWGKDILGIIWYEL